VLHSPYVLPLRAHTHVSRKKGNMDQMIEMCRSQTHMSAFGINQRMAHERNRQDHQVQWQQQNQHSQLANTGSLSHGHLECFASSLGYPMQHGAGVANGMTVPNAHFAALAALHATSHMHTSGQSANRLQIQARGGEGGEGRGVGDMLQGAQVHVHVQKLNREHIVTST